MIFGVISLVVGVLAAHQALARLRLQRKGEEGEEGEDKTPDRQSMTHASCLDNPGPLASPDREGAAFGRPCNPALYTGRGL